MAEAFHQLFGDLDDLRSETRLVDCDYLGEVTVPITYPRKNDYTEPYYPPIYFQMF